MTETDVIDPMLAYRRSSTIKVHGPGAFEGMRKAGRLAGECLDMLTEHVRPGAVTDDLDRMAREFILDNGALPACLYYRGYAKTLCISPNHVVCHGIPGPRTLRDGEIANIDVTVIVDGWHGDTSRMYLLGDVAPRARRLVDVTYEGFERGLAQVKPGAHFGDIGHVFHDAPNVLHFGRKGEGARLEPGMIFTIEPMVNLGKHQVKLLADGWTAVTRDKSLSAQCEHSIGVTETGAEVFTASPAGLFRPVTR